LAEIIQFIPKRDVDARENLAEFIRRCRSELTVFGADLQWDENYWPTAGISFGNMDQKSRALAIEKAMQQPFVEFAKAYVRYQQGHKPTKTKQEMPALKCLERALSLSSGRADLAELNIAILDMAATIARDQLSSGQAYHTGRELARLASFVSEKYLISGRLDWKSPNKRPTDTIRTGDKARQLREKKLPHEDAVSALADIFAGNPNSPRDIFTSSVCALLLCAPSRVSEILSLPVDCEVWETKRDGTKAYGWRFQPGKGGLPYIKWIPDSMESLAQEAIKRIRSLTAEARNIAKWHEKNPELFYRHKNCPDVPEDQPLTVIEAGLALGIPIEDSQSCRSGLRQYGLSGRGGGNTLATLNKWVASNLPEDFPWYDKERDIHYSEALFCLKAKQLRSDMEASPVIVWKPTANTVNDDLSSVEKNDGYIRPSIFDRNGFNDGRDSPLKMTSHQFRHLLNTMAQRGGLSQSEIARWSGRVDMKQNRAYDHMSEFELVAMIRSHDSSLSLDRPLEEIAEQVAAKLPMSRQEFNTLTMPTAHVTEYGFCVHDFVMSPCQRFRDCLNCTEQVCVKGDRRLDRIKGRYEDVKRLKDLAEREIGEGTAGADRWYEIHKLTEKRLKELIGILENPAIQDGAIVKLRNENEFSPLRRAVETRLGVGKANVSERPMLEELRNMLGDGLG
jgi:hypothetical protein